MILRLLAPWLLLLAAAGLSAWIFRRPQGAAGPGEIPPEWLDPQHDVLIKKGAWAYAFENAGAGASLVSLLVSASCLLFGEPPKAAVFAGLAVILAGLCWPATVRRPWLRLDAHGIQWKSLQGNAAQSMAWSEIESVSLAWHARLSAQIEIGRRPAGRKPLRLKASHLCLSPKALVHLLESRREASRSARRPLATPPSANRDQ